MTVPDKSKNSLRVVERYIEHVRALYADDPAEAATLLLVLNIYRAQLSHQSKPALMTLDWLQTLKHGVRQAEILLVDILENEQERMAGWYWGSHPTNQPQRLSNLLCELTMVFTVQIDTIENLFPRHKTFFERERLRYRLMKDEADATT